MFTKIGNGCWWWWWRRWDHFIHIPAIGAMNENAYAFLVDVSCNKATKKNGSSQRSLKKKRKRQRRHPEFVETKGNKVFFICWLTMLTRGRYGDSGASMSRQPVKNSKWQKRVNDYGEESRRHRSAGYVYPHRLFSSYQKAFVNLLQWNGEITTHIKKPRFVCIKGRISKSNPNWALEQYDTLLAQKKKELPPLSFQLLHLWEL